MFHTNENFNDFLLPKPTHFKWDSEKIEMYISFLNSEQTISKVSLFWRYKPKQLFIWFYWQGCSSLTEVSYDNERKCFALKRHRVKGGKPQSKKVKPKWIPRKLKWEKKTSAITDLKAPNGSVSKSGIWARWTSQFCRFSASFSLKYDVTDAMLQDSEEKKVQYVRFLLFDLF